MRKLALTIGQTLSVAAFAAALTLTGMTEAAGSPVFGLSKTTVWTYKSKLLNKCDSLLRCLCPSLY